jgi:hypothetical protein
MTSPPKVCDVPHAAQGAGRNPTATRFPIVVAAFAGRHSTFA